MISNSVVVDAARDLMASQTKKNGAPAWPLTELAVSKGRALANKHGAREDIVVIALYLAHTVFSKEIHGSVQQKHMFLSVDFADDFLAKENVSLEDRRIIKNAIQAHHAHVPTKTIEAEIVKNAEGFKFLSLEGAQAFFADLRRRGMTAEEAKEEVLRKMDQKFGYLTLPDCIEEARKNMVAIKVSFG